MIRQIALVRLAVLVALLPGSVSAQVIWEAFNDHRGGADTSPNATTWEMGAGDTGGPLKDISTGANLAATFTVEEEGEGSLPFNPNSAVDPGSPADLLFAGKCTIGGPDNEGIPGLRGPDSIILLRFSNLDPSRRFSFRGTTCRGNDYEDRWTIFRIVEAESAVAAHVDGSQNQNIFTHLTFRRGRTGPFDVVLNSGDNKAGSLIGWDKIDPGADGTFAIEARHYFGEAPFGTPSAGPYTYGLSALYLAEVQVGGGVDLITSVNHDPEANTTELTWRSKEGEFFELRKSLDLTDDPSAWPIVRTGVPAAAAPAEFTTEVVDTDATEPRAIYRLFLIPPPPIIEDD